MTSSAKDFAVVAESSEELAVESALLDEEPPSLDDEATVVTELTVGVVAESSALDESFAFVESSVLESEASAGVDELPAVSAGVAAEVASVSAGLE